MDSGRDPAPPGAVSMGAPVNWFQGETPLSTCASVPQGSIKKEFPQNLGGSDTCYFCQKRVYVMERLSAEGKFFHRSCFRCHICEATLWPGGYRQHPGDGELAWEAFRGTLHLALPGRVRSLKVERNWGAAHEVEKQTKDYAFFS